MGGEVDLDMHVTNETFADTNDGQRSPLPTVHLNAESSALLLGDSVMQHADI